MSSPRKKPESMDAVDDCISSLEDNDDTSTSTEIYKEARDFEVKEEAPKLLGNASDADVSNSSDSAHTVIAPGTSCKLLEAPEEVTKLQRSPKRVHKRTKLDIPGDDSSDEMDSKPFKRSPKKMKSDIKEEMVAESCSGMSQISKTNLKRERLDSEKLVDTKDDSGEEKCQSDTTDKNTISSKYLKCSNIKSDIDDNASDVPVKSGPLMKSPEKFKKAKSEPREIVTTTAEDKIEAGFMQVKASLLIAAAVSNVIHEGKRSPNSGISKDDTETIKHEIDTKTGFEEHRTDSATVASQELETSELIAADVPTIFGKVEGIENEDLSEQSTISIERMEFSSESNIDHGIETTTDVEKMDCSSESWTGFESIKTGSESNTGPEKMECKSESSVSREEMELESASVKSTEIEVMEYSSESISFLENDSISNEIKSPVEYNIDDSSKCEREAPIPCIFGNEPIDIPKPEKEPPIPRIVENEPVVSPKPEKEPSIPHTFENEPVGIPKPEKPLIFENEPIGSHTPQKEPDIPHIFENEPTGSPKPEKEPPIPNVFQKEPDVSSKTERELSIPSIVVENEYFDSNESQSNSNEVRSIIESNNDETLDINRKFSIPRVESFDDTDEYNQTNGAAKDTDLIIDSTNLTTDDNKTVDDKVSVEEPSNVGDEPSPKRIKSIDSDKDASVSNVLGSTEAPKCTVASSVEFSDTDSDEFKNSDSEESQRKIKKRK